MSLRELIAAAGLALMKTGAAMQQGKKSYLFQRDKLGWRFVAGSDHATVLRTLEAENKT